MNAEQQARAIAKEILENFDAKRQIPPFSSRLPAFNLDLAYRVTAEIRELREARGETPVGRKIGFTNRNIWAECNVSAPVWGYMYDTTVHQLEAVQGRFRVSHLLEPKIEPEVIFGFARPPKPGMDEAEILRCVEWIAPGFEIVQSIYPHWKFQGADTVAFFGVHGALLVGKRLPVSAMSESDWLEKLVALEIDLLCNGKLEEQGTGANALDGPLTALRYFIEVLGQDTINPQLAAGEIVTTGTLTRLRAILPGETWSTRFRGIPFEGYSLHIE